MFHLQPLENASQGLGDVRMTNPGGLNAQGCTCMEGDLYNFLQCSAGRWPKVCQPDNHLSSAGRRLLFQGFTRSGVIFQLRFPPALN